MRLFLLDTSLSSRTAKNAKDVKQEIRNLARFAFFVVKSFYVAPAGIATGFYTSLIHKRRAQKPASEKLIWCCLGAVLDVVDRLLDALDA